MNKKFQLPAVVALFLGITLQAHAAIKCVGKNAGVNAAENQLEVPEGSRIKFFELDQSIVYLTHKRHFYSLEMFAPGLEQRVYSEGTLLEKQPLTIAIWTRDQLLEVSCGL